MVDENIRKSIEDEKFIIFLIGVTKPDGTEYGVLDAPVPVYIQIGDDWNSEKVKAYFISDSSDESVDVKVIKRKPLNTNTEKYFAQLQLYHFSPYIVYNEKTENNLTTAQGSNALLDENQDNPESLENLDTGYDSIRPILIASLGILLVLTVGELVIFDLKKKN